MDDRRPQREGAEVDKHWVTINGRRWRRTDPALPPETVQALLSHLGRARAAVAAAHRTSEPTALAHAHERVNLAKIGLGERGPHWWHSNISERLARAQHHLERLDELAAETRAAPRR